VKTLPSRLTRNQRDAVCEGASDNDDDDDDDDDENRSTCSDVSGATGSCSGDQGRCKNQGGRVRRSGLLADWSVVDVATGRPKEETFQVVLTKTANVLLAFI
jgi:hypothetical protein